MDDILKKIEDGQISLCSVPFKDRTYKICLAAVRIDGDYLKNVPDEYRTLQICYMAVEKCGFSIQYVPDKFRTTQMYQKAIKAHPFAIEYVPESDITEDLCITAVQYDWRVINALPPQFQNQRIAALALMKFLRAEGVHRNDFKREYLTTTFFARFEGLLSIFLKNTLDEKP